MADEAKVPNWFLWLCERFPVILLVGVIVAAIVFVAVYHVDSRLTEIEDQLRFAPPSRYKKPDIGNFTPGQTTTANLTGRHAVYVPVYSHIYFQGGAAYPLETTLSIRNVDMSRPIFVESVEYYDTDGKLAKTHLDKLIKLKPLQTIEFLIERRDSSGGSGANFLVRWGSTSEVSSPLIEAVMVGTTGTQGISFGRTGIEISAGDGGGNP